jgi:ssRNA-specific RNase YbeY (16S rRNA maturation enzyme)
MESDYKNSIISSLVYNWRELQKPTDVLSNKLMAVPKGK